MSSGYTRPRFKGFSPRAWGWSVRNNDPEAVDVVLPTCVGMVHTAHPRLKQIVLFSPRVWGWSPGHSRTSTVKRSFPHIRGDDPYALIAGGWKGFEFSPRVWGWSGLGRDRQRLRTVLPTCVGMVRFGVVLSVNSTSFSPHAWGWTVHDLERMTLLGGPRGP